MDETLLVAINQGWAHPVLDVFFTWVSRRDFFTAPLLAIILLYCWRLYGINGAKAWGVLVAVIVLGDQFGLLLKHLLAQPRPCFELYTLIRQPGLPPNTACGDSLMGMPSNHALNYFSAFAFVSYALRRPLLSYGLLMIAILVSLSRIYLGKHYPSQVLVGAAIGALLGFLCAWFAVKYLKFMQDLSRRTHEQH